MLRLIPIDVSSAFLGDVAQQNERRARMPTDHERIDESISDGRTGESGSRQMVRRLVRNTREDERSQCAEITRRNESFKSVAEIEARRQQ